MMGDQEAGGQILAMWCGQEPAKMPDVPVLADVMRNLVIRFQPRSALTNDGQAVSIMLDGQQKIELTPAKEDFDAAVDIVGEPADEGEMKQTLEFYIDSGSGPVAAQGTIVIRPAQNDPGAPPRP